MDNQQQVEIADLVVQEDQASVERDYYIPILLLSPMFEGDIISHGRFSLVRRLRQTSASDLYDLDTKHKLHIPHQIMEFFLSHCHMEVRVSGTKSLDEAMHVFAAFHIAAYAAGCSPFATPYICTHSVNDYSGLNTQDDATLILNTAEELKTGFTSADGQVEAWPMLIQFDWMVNGIVTINPTLFQQVSEWAETWLEMIAKEARDKSKKKPLMAFQQAAITAPSVRPLSQSFLHVWSGLEGLFPTMSGEGLTFKMALYLAQMNAEFSSEKRLTYVERAKKQYAVRSKIAHGSIREISTEEWNESWKLITGSLEAIIKRGSLPTEQALLEELLADPVVGDNDIEESISAKT